MFFHLIDKIYIVNESSRPERTALDVINYESYRQDKEVHPTFESLYIALNSKLVKDRRVTLLIVPDCDFGEMLLDYCHTLGLGEDEFFLLKEHSNFCEQYIEDTEKDVSVPSGIDVRWSASGRKRVRHPGLFPAEFCINCLDEDWARRKYEYFRMYDLYARIKDRQYEDFRMGRSVSMPVIENNDQEIKKLYTDEGFRRSIASCINTDFLDLDIEDYIKIFPTLGYNRFNAWKYNFRLAGYLKKTGYRIDRRN